MDQLAQAVQDEGARREQSSTRERLRRLELRVGGLESFNNSITGRDGIKVNGTVWSLDKPQAQAPAAPTVDFDAWLDGVLVTYAIPATLKT